MVSEFELDAWLLNYYAWINTNTIPLVFTIFLLFLQALVQYCQFYVALRWNPEYVEYVSAVVVFQEKYKRYIIDDPQYINARPLVLFSFVDQQTQTFPSKVHTLEAFLDAVKDLRVYK